MSKKTVLRFTTKELNTLVDNTNAHVKLITSKRKLSLHPICLNDVKGSIHGVLDASLAKFDHELKGILLSYKKIKVLNTLAKLLHDDPYLYVTIRADFYVFQPEVGCTLFGIVNKKSPDHLGCLVHKVFNVALPRPELGTDKEWQGIYVELGETVTFTVEYLDLTGSLPYMRGSLLDIGKIPDFEENSNNEDQGEVNDNEEEKLSSQDIKDLMGSVTTHFEVVKKTKKKKIKKEKFTSDSSDLPERVSNNISPSCSPSLDEREKKAKSRQKTKGSSSNSLPNEVKRDEDEYVSQDAFVLTKAKEKGNKKRKKNDYTCPLTNLDDIYNTNLIGPEYSSNEKIKKQKHRNILKQESAISDVKVEKSEMSEGEEQNISPLKVLESAENVVPKTKKKRRKKKDDETDESILNPGNLALSSLMTDNLKTKWSGKLNSILSDDLRGVVTSTPKERNEFQKFISNVSEIKRFNTDDVGTPNALKLSKKQKIKKMDTIEKDLINLMDTDLHDYRNKIGSDREMKVKPLKKDKTKKSNESNESISSSSGSPDKQKIIKGNEKLKSGSMSEARNILLENMINKLNTTMQVPNCDTDEIEPGTSQNVKSSKRRKTIERDEKVNSDLSSHSSDSEIYNDCSVTKNVNTTLDSGGGSAEKLQKNKSKTEILNTANSPINKLNERSPRKTTKNKHNNKLDMSVGNSVETKLSSQSEKSTKKNKKTESDEAHKIKQTKKNDVTSWALPDSLMEIQKNILEKLKSEMSPSKDKKLEMSPTKDKKLKSVTTPTKVKKLKSVRSPGSDRKLKLEMSPTEDKKFKIEMSPKKDKKLKRKRNLVDGTCDNVDENPTIRKLVKLDYAYDKQSEGVTDFKVTKSKLQSKEASETMKKVSDSPIKGKGTKHKAQESSSKGAEEGEKSNSTIEHEKEALLNKMMSNIAGVIKLEEGDDMKMKGRKETKKERKKSKQVLDKEINDKSNMLSQSSDDPLEKHIYGDGNSITSQYEKYEVYGKKQENKKKKNKDKLLISEEDGNMSGAISNAMDGFFPLNKDISDGEIVNKLLNAAAKNGSSKKAKQKEQSLLTSRNNQNENLKQVSHIASTEPRQEKGKKIKTKKNNDKVGLAETQEPDHRKKEKRHTAISQQEEESPAALAERLLQEFINQKKK